MNPLCRLKFLTDFLALYYLIIQWVFPGSMLSFKTKQRQFGIICGQYRMGKKTSKITKQPKTQLGMVVSFNPSTQEGETGRSLHLRPQSEFQGSYGYKEKTVLNSSSQNPNPNPNKTKTKLQTHIYHSNIIYRGCGGGKQDHLSWGIKGGNLRRSCRHNQGSLCKASFFSDFNVKAALKNLSFFS